MPTEQGFSNQKKKGRAQFKTIQNLFSGQYGAPVASKSLYEITPTAQAIVSVSDILGSDGQVAFWNIQITGHTAVSGNVLRMITGTLIGWEYEIVQVVDANNFYILPISDTKPVATETAKIMGWVTNKASSDGSISVTITEDPIGPVDLVLLDFSSTNVDNTAYVTLLASAPETRKIQVFMSSGEPLYLAFGGAGSEVDQAYIIPGGNGLIDFEIPAGTRLSLKAVNVVTVNTGIIIVNLLG